ncbi:hypothetical protein LV780_09460 [Cereibacter azotoformans]|uniref:hypothetical protein n=1 Tax=Cereibacter azotoformans TaxID=43057 RepID=UPI0011C12962|nr:hypothetical protein [Cereibacter azotoformans]UIJ29528.1 hypothetical protein LV780_09460 [Cereibacter azotoformans]
MTDWQAVFRGNDWFGLDPYLVAPEEIDAFNEALALANLTIDGNPCPENREHLLNQVTDIKRYSAGLASSGEPRREATLDLLLAWLRTPIWPNHISRSEAKRKSSVGCFLRGAMAAQPVPLAAYRRLAATDPIAFDLVSSGTALALEEGYDDAEDRKFACAVLRGEIKRPSRRGKHPKSQRRLDYMLTDLVKIAELRGFKPLRNEESDHRNSACDLVSEALTQEGFRYCSYETVRKAWLRRSVPLFPELTHP